MDFRRLVKTGGGKLHAGEIGLFDEVVKGDFLKADADPVRQEDDFLFRHVPVLGGEFDQPIADLAGGVISGHAVKVGA